MKLTRVAMTLLLMFLTSASAWADSWSDTFYGTDVSYEFGESSYIQ